jgi:ribosomal-protein-alanine N-acetyltransferase
MDLNEFESTRLKFRFFNEEDFDALTAIFTNERVCKYLPVEGCYATEQVKKVLGNFIKKKDNAKRDFVCAVIEKEKNQLIGYAGVSYVREFDAYEIKYGFNEKYWNKGYGTETAQKMKEAASSIGHEKLIALADINNIASQTILEKIGYHKVSSIKLWGLDLYYYEMIL